MVQFLPLDVTDEDSVGVVLSHLDNAIQYGEHEEPKEPADVRFSPFLPSLQHSACCPKPFLHPIPSPDVYERLSARRKQQNTALTRFLASFLADGSRRFRPGRLSGMGKELVESVAVLVVTVFVPSCVVAGELSKLKLDEKEREI
jgi:hypothetical protein